jgi:hypothetical protein
MATPNGISLKNPYIRDNLIGSNKLMGTYSGFTRDTKDEAQLRGRIAVFIPAFFDNGDPGTIKTNWFNCEWSSPFWGQTFRGNRGKDEKNYTNSQSTYGMWMIPPDPGTEVLVAFRDGNIKLPVIIGCPIVNQYNYSVPGYPGGVSYGDPAINAPVTEKNLNSDPGKHGANSPRPMHADIAEQITQQGLINDNIRGAGKSGARRESPSRVFGIQTPGDWDTREPQEGEGKVRKAGHQFVMDDINGSRLMRLRSGGGNQILLSDDTNSIYCINARGEVWWEMDNTGNFSLYAKRGINMRTQGDFNLRADGSVNIEGGGDVNIKAAGDMRASQYVGGAIQEALGAFGIPTLGNGGRVNITGKQSLQLYGDRNVRITSGGGDTDINAGGVLNMQGNGISPLNGAAVNISAPSFGSVLIHASTNLQLQGMFLEMAAPIISAGGGLINLNTKPPIPLPPGIALPAFKLPGKPMADVDDKLVPFSREAAKQGASAFPTQGKREGLALDVYTICTKLITAEPYIGHAQGDPIKKASDPDFLSSIVDSLPPGSSGDPANPAPGDVVVTDPDTGESVIKKGIGYVDEAGENLKSAQDQIQGAYDEVSGQIEGEIDAVKNELKEQFPEYEAYADAFNNLGSLLDGDLTAIQRLDIIIGMLGATIPPIRFPTSNQLEEEIVGLNSKLSELEAKLSEYGIDADQLMADLLTGNIAGLKSQAMGLINEGIADGLNNSELTAKLAENGLDISGLDPTSPMFPSIAVTDKDGNTFVDFSKGMSDPAAALLAGSKLNTEFSKIEAEIGNVTGVLGDTQKSGLLSFADGIGGNEKFIESNVGQTLKKADALFAQAGSQGSRTPEQQAAFTQGTAIMANAPRLMAGWVLASDVPGGKMLYNKDLANKRQVEIELFTATDDMNMRQILDESKPAGENYGTLLQKIKAVKKDYFAQRTPQYQDSELGKAVQANT